MLYDSYIEKIKKNCQKVTLTIHSSVYIVINTCSRTFSTNAGGFDRVIKPQFTITLNLFFTRIHIP